MGKDDFIHSFGLENMLPTKLDKKAIQIDFSSQFSDNKKSIVTQRIIISNMMLT